MRTSVAIRKRKRRIRQNKNKMLSIILFLALIVLYLQYSKKPNTIITPLASNQEKNPILQTVERIKGDADPTILQKEIINTVDDQWVNYSVFVKDLTDDFVVDINGSVIYPAASVSKIPVLAFLYHKASNNEVDLDKKITVQEEDVQDYGTGSIQYDPLGTQYSYRTLAQLLMKKSDNTAAYVLNKYVLGLQNLQIYLESLGLTQTNMNTNHTSNKDMALLMERIFRGEIANEALTEEMLAFMKDSDFEQRLPKLLPDTATVYHKIGNGVGIIHDVGVVKTENALYYIGILTQDLRNEEQAKELSAEISKRVYEYITDE